MVAELDRYAVTDERILDAMRRIPRHAVLEHITDLDVVHDVDRAIAAPASTPAR